MYNPEVLALLDSVSELMESPAGEAINVISVGEGDVVDIGADPITDNLRALLAPFGDRVRLHQEGPALAC